MPLNLLHKWCPVEILRVMIIVLRRLALLLLHPIAVLLRTGPFQGTGIWLSTTGFTRQMASRSTNRIPRRSGRKYSLCKRNSCCGSKGSSNRITSSNTAPVASRNEPQRDSCDYGDSPADCDFTWLRCCWCYKYCDRDFCNTSLLVSLSKEIAVSTVYIYTYRYTLFV